MTVLLSLNSRLYLTATLNLFEIKTPTNLFNFQKHEKKTLIKLNRALQKKNYNKNS